MSRSTSSAERKPRARRRFGIVGKLVAMVLVGTAIVLAAVLAYSYFTARQLLQQEMVLRVEATASSVSNQVESIQAAVQKVTQTLAVTMEVDRTVSQEQLYGLMEGVLSSDEGLAGITVAAAPGETIAGATDGCFSVDRWNESLVRNDMHASVASYRIGDAYLLPTVLGTPQWTEPYYGEGSSQVLDTYSVPFYLGGGTDGPRRLGGVVACDISLEWLGEVMAMLKLGKDGYGFIISKNGTYISHPVRSLVMQDTIFSVLQRRGDFALRAVAQKMIAGQTGIASFVAVANNIDSWMAYAPVPSTGWSVILMLPKREVLSRIAALSRNAGIAGGGGLVLLMLAAFFIARGIARPVVRLSTAAHALAQDLDAPLPQFKGHDEVADLGHDFGYMRDELKHRMTELAETTAIKERIESELRLAADIQQSLIPKTFPPFPDLPEVDIYATLEPAREIGGDFYDFFFLDGQRICFAIADVSGKGVPAALFMVATRSFLRSLMREERSVARALERLNEQLEEENDACMFVTIFCGVIDLGTGECVYANAGHNPPLLASKDGALRVLDKPRGVILGVQPGVTYTEGEFTLAVGDSLVLYTDGVTEAMDKDGALFGDERLREVASASAGGDCRRYVADIRAAVAGFAGDAEQSDDITLLVIRRIEATEA